MELSLMTKAIAVLIGIQISVWHRPLVERFKSIRYNDNLIPKEPVVLSVSEPMISDTPLKMPPSITTFSTPTATIFVADQSKRDYYHLAVFGTISILLFAVYSILRGRSEDHFIDNAFFDIDDPLAILDQIKAYNDVLTNKFNASQLACEQLERDKSKSDVVIRELQNTLRQARVEALKNDSSIRSMGEKIQEQDEELKTKDAIIKMESEIKAQIIKCHNNSLDRSQIEALFQKNIDSQKAIDKIADLKEQLNHSKLRHSRTRTYIKDNDDVVRGLRSKLESQTACSQDLGRQIKELKKRIGEKEATLRQKNKVHTKESERLNQRKWMSLRQRNKTVRQLKGMLLCENVTLRQKNRAIRKKDEAIRQKEELSMENRCLHEQHLSAIHTKDAEYHELKKKHSKAMRKKRTEIKTKDDDMSKIRTELNIQTAKMANLRSQLGIEEEDHATTISHSEEVDSNGDRASLEDPDKYNVVLCKEKERIEQERDIAFKAQLELQSRLEKLSDENACLGRKLEQVVEEKKDAIATKNAAVAEMLSYYERKAGLLLSEQKGILDRDLRRLHASRQNIQKLWVRDHIRIKIVQKSLKSANGKVNKHAKIREALGLHKKVTRSSRILQTSSVTALLASAMYGQELDDPMTVERSQSPVASIFNDHSQDMDFESEVPPYIFSDAEQGCIDHCTEIMAIEESRVDSMIDAEPFRPSPWHGFNGFAQSLFRALPTLENTAIHTLEPESNDSDDWIAEANAYLATSEFEIEAPAPNNLEYLGSNDGELMVEVENYSAGQNYDSELLLEDATADERPTIHEEIEVDPNSSHTPYLQTKQLSVADDNQYVSAAITTAVPPHASPSLVQSPLQIKRQAEFWNDDLQTAIEIIRGKVVLVLEEDSHGNADLEWLETNLDNIETDASSSEGFTGAVFQDTLKDIISKVATLLESQRVATDRLEVLRGDIEGDLQSNFDFALFAIPTIVDQHLNGVFPDPGLSVVSTSSGSELSEVDEEWENKPKARPTVIERSGTFTQPATGPISFAPQIPGLLMLPPPQPAISPSPASRRFQRKRILANGRQVFALKNSDDGDGLDIPNTLQSTSGGRYPNPLDHISPGPSISAVPTFQITQAAQVPRITGVQNPQLGHLSNADATVTPQHSMKPAPAATPPATSLDTIASIIQETRDSPLFLPPMFSLPDTRGHLPLLFSESHPLKAAINTSSPKTNESPSLSFEADVKQLAAIMEAQPEPTSTSTPIPTPTAPLSSTPPTISSASTNAPSAHPLRIITENTYTARLAKYLRETENYVNRTGPPGERWDLQLERARKAKRSDECKWSSGMDASSFRTAFKNLVAATHTETKAQVESYAAGRYEEYKAKVLHPLWEKWDRDDRVVTGAKERYDFEEVQQAAQADSERLLEDGFKSQAAFGLDGMQIAEDKKRLAEAAGEGEKKKAAKGLEMSLRALDDLAALRKAMREEKGDEKDDKKREQGGGAGGGGQKIRKRG